MSTTSSFPAVTEAIDGHSLDIAEDRRNQLKQLFPEVFTEGAVDFTKLKAVLGELVTDAKEHYGLSWAGKYDAFREIQKQTTCTLVPDREGSIDFDTTGNIFIEGENLEVLRVLQKSYYGRVKMIYIDPPYNTGNDSFIYPDDFAERLEEYQKRAGITDEEGFLNKQDLWKKNTRENGQFHSVWLSMMYPRLYLAKNLLRDDGVIFVSIDDTEVANLRLLMDEIFGEENFLANITWEKRYTRSNDAKLFASVIEHILVYRKSAEVATLREPRTEKSNAIYSNPDNDPRGDWTSVSYVSQRTREQRPNLSYPVKNPFSGETVEHPTNAWKYSKEQYVVHVRENRLYWGESGGHKFPRVKKFLSELSEGLVPTNLWAYEESGTVDEGTKAVDTLVGKDTFDYPKPTRLLKRMMRMVSGSEEPHIVLDFFAGSGTTAHAVLELNREDGGNRRFICVQMPEPTDEGSEAHKAGYETIADIARARIRKVVEKMKVDENGKLELEVPGDRGFRSYTLAPSNFKVWRNALDGDDVNALLLEFQDAHRPEAQAENMVTELLLKAGLPLTTATERVEVGGGTVYNIDGGRLVVLLEQLNDDIRDYLLEAKPQHVVCLDRVFDDNDQLLTNLGLQLHEAGIELTVL